jgi:hypothetical protein
LIVLSRFALSLYAIQNDVYMGNLFIGVPLLVVGGILVLASAVVARLQAREVSWTAGLVLAAVAGGLLALLYALFGGHYVSVGPPPNWPPYLNGTMMIVIPVLDLAVFGAGWVWGAWGGRMGRQPSRRGVV